MSPLLNACIWPQLSGHNVTHNINNKRRQNANHANINNWTSCELLSTGCARTRKVHLVEVPSVEIFSALVHDSQWLCRGPWCTWLLWLSTYFSVVGTIIITMWFPDDITSCPVSSPRVYQVLVKYAFWSHDCHMAGTCGRWHSICSEVQQIWQDLRHTLWRRCC